MVMLRWTFSARSALSTCFCDLPDRAGPSMGLETIAVAETVYRYSSYDTPFWARPNSQPGRWHSAGDGPTQYLAMSANAAWAELIRNEELTTEEEVVLVSIKMWAVQIERAMVVDYSTFEKAD